MKAIHKIMWRIGAGCGAALLAAGCTTNEMHMEVSYDQLQFGAQDNVARYVNVAADGAWSCEVVPAEAASWLAATNDNNEVLVVEAVGDNRSLEPRQARIRLRDAEHNALLKTIAVTQEAWPEEAVWISTAEDELLFGPGPKDEVVQVDVMDGVNWTVEVAPEAQQWLTAVRTGEKGVLVRIKGNDGEQMRCGTIQLRTTEVDAEPCLIRVYQLSWAQDKLAVEFDGGEFTANVGPEAGEETYFRINSSFVSGFYQVYTATVAHATFEEAVQVSWLRVEQVNADESLWRLQTTEANRSAVAREGFVVLYCTYKVDNRSATVICSARVQQAAVAQ